MTEQTFQAVCGQKCGPVTVPSLETKNCPQCGHPLTILPQARLAVDTGGPAPAPSAAAIPAAATGEVIAGAPVVTVPPFSDDTPQPGKEQPRAMQGAPAADAKPADVPATDEAEAAGAAALAQEPTRAEKIEEVADALRFMGYSEPQSYELAENAMANLEAQPPAGAAQAAG